MVQVEDTARIKRRWVDAGRPACDHSSLSPEFYLGSRTGDWVCVGCGREFSRREVEAMRRAGRPAE